MQIYELNLDYIKYLRQFDSKVSDPKIDSDFGRKYVGIVIDTKKFSYFAPLSSKVFQIKKGNNGEENYLLDKFGAKKLKNTFTDVYLKDIHGEPLGAVKLNYMIPIPKGVAGLYEKIDIEDMKKTKDNRIVKYALLIELEEKSLESQYIADLICSKAKNFILKSRYDEKTKSMCCNFRLLEEKAIEYQQILENNKKSFDGKVKFIQMERKKELLGSLSYEENHIKKSGIEIAKITDGLRYIQDSTILDVVFSTSVKEEDSCKLKKIEENHYVLPVIARDVKRYNLIGEQIWKCLDDSRCNELEEDMERTR